MRDTLGIFGKIAAEPDFVSLGADRWSASGLDVWLQRAFAELGTAGRRFPSETALLLEARGTLVVAAAWPSADAARRPFPFVVSGEAGGVALGPERRAAFALDANPIVRVAAPLARAAADGAGVAALAAALDDAAAAIDEELRAGEARTAALLAGSARPLLDELGDAAAYALTTLRTACKEVDVSSRGADGARGLLLRCPATTEGARAFWVVLATRLLDGGGPSVVHVRDPALPHVELCLGPPPPSLLAKATGAQTAVDHHWSLVPRSADARAAAREELTDVEARALLEGEPTFADLLRTFTS